MKKSVKKLNLNKTSILKLNETSTIAGGRNAPLEQGSGQQGCGGFTTQPDCPPSIGCAK
ncbi:hypothetical protein H2O64_17180 [Kordia sp. YSTF-M3]|uniref:Natural product n=1 Tax=Kordia aestuariivivens TaxID=2759037 RepID=A0ABR7QD09_9FLAO|nr:hypothetical protein [Kordia aestuariivivens]MBC8756412.1 hypothetical protein [Kordia aestuariivivens]